MSRYLLPAAGRLLRRGALAFCRFWHWLTYDPPCDVCGTRRDCVDCLWDRAIK